MLYTHDGNKNVSEVLFANPINGIGAHYEYATFGVSLNLSCSGEFCNLKSKIGLQDITVDAFSNFVFWEIGVNLYEYNGDSLGKTEEITFENPILGLIR